MEKRKKGLPSTNRLIPERAWAYLTISCTGEKPPSPLLIRSGDEWLVGPKEFRADLKASVGEEPDQPPKSGWKFYNAAAGSYEDDPTLICTKWCSMRQILIDIAILQNRLIEIDDDINPTA